MDSVFEVLAEPRRRSILRLVQNRELAAGEIAARFSVTRPAVSQHLKVLLDAGLLTQRRSGTRRLYRARNEGLAEIDSFLRDFGLGGALDQSATADSAAVTRAPSDDAWKVW